MDSELQKLCVIKNLWPDQLTPELVDILAIQDINKDENPEYNIEVGDIYCPLQQPHLLLGSSKPILGLSLKQVGHLSG